MLADVSVTAFVPILSLTDTNGTWAAPGSASGAWISSEITVTLCRFASSAMRFTCSALSTRPVGLCGLQSRYARAPALNDASSASRSRSQPPPGTCASGESTTRRPTSLMVIANGG